MEHGTSTVAEMEQTKGPMMPRKRKPGRRTPSGRLSRAKLQPYDRGTERAQMIRAIYGTDCTDAIGRAYRAGLLGDEAVAKPRLDLGRHLAALYWRHLKQGGWRCALADSNAGAVVIANPERERRREAWLVETLRAVDALGRPVRRAFDELVIDPWPDEGPAWLDRLILASRCRDRPERADMQTLAKAVAALDWLLDRP